MFFNRRRDEVKVLYWDRTGSFVWSKRGGGFARRGFGPGPDGSVEVEAAEMALVVEGIDLAGARRRPRWVCGAPKVEAM